MIFATKYRKLVINIVSLLFIILFVYSAVSKLLDYETFTLQLAQSPLLSAYAGIIAWLVPGLEVVLAVLLVFEKYRMPALYASFTLMVMFTAYIYIILNFSDFVPCSCGGVLEDLSWTQHLIFNWIFILLAGVAIFLSSRGNKKMKVLLLALLTIIGVGTIVLLFAFSEKKMHRNNAFHRRYLPHPTEKVGEFNLEYDSYYLTGYKDSIVYLGNYSAPLYVTALNLNTKSQLVLPISISNTSLPFRKVRLQIKPPYFRLGDGSVPVLFQGNISGPPARPLPYDSLYFLQFVVVDSLRTGIVTVDGKSGKKAIGLSTKLAGKDSSLFRLNTLKTASIKPFEHDGVLAWNADLKAFLYIYYYKNKYEVIDENLQPLSTNSTIDTLSEPALDITYSKKEALYILGGKSIMVNRISATSNNYLYINSDRLGRYEDDAPLKSASIIDVYNIKENTYAFSFYLYHQPGGKMYEFQIHDNVLIAQVEKKLFIYRLKPKFFNSGSTSKHTGRYQD